MQTSQDNGQSFQIYDNVKLCWKCGGKTILCPHKVSDEQLVTLPSQTTHVKFYHPRLVLKTNFNLAEYDDQYKANQEQKTAYHELTEFENPSVSPSFFRIWGEYYNQRKGKKPLTNRPIPVQKQVSMIQDVYNYRWKLEESLKLQTDYEKLAPISFSTTFYQFLFDWYQIDTVVLKAAHDLFSAFEQEERNNQVVSIFCRHLSGYDDSIWKYMYVSNKLIYHHFETDRIDMIQYRNFIELLYPSRSTELYEHMELEFKAFCKNKLQRQRVEEHLIHMIAKDIEPNIEFFQKTLAKFDSTKKGALSIEDFDEAIAQIMPSSSNKERAMLYNQALLHFKGYEVPIERLSRIACYLMIRTCHDANWERMPIISPDFVASRSNSETDLSPAI